MRSSLFESMVILKKIGSFHRLKDVIFVSQVLVLISIFYDFFFKCSMEIFIFVDFNKVIKIGIVRYCNVCQPCGLRLIYTHCILRRRIPLSKKNIYVYIYIYSYIYILTNLLSTSIHGDKEQISNHCLGKKEKDYREKKRKKRKGQLRHTSWKKSRDMQSVGAR